MGCTLCCLKEDPKKVRDIGNTKPGEFGAESNQPITHNKESKDIISNDSIRSKTKTKKGSVINLNDIKIEGSISSSISKKIKTDLGPKISLHKPENWKKLLSDLKGNQKLKEIAFAKTRLDFNNMRAVKKYFKELSIGKEIEKAWVIYLWVTSNFEYNGIGLKNDNFGEQDPESVLKLGKCVCEGFGTIFRDLCESVDLRVEAISGQTKKLDYEYGESFGIGHKWSAIIIEDNWYPCDPTWGAGYLDDDYNFVKEFNPYYFFTPPQFLLTDHFGENYKINEGKMTLNEFKYEPTLKLQFHVLNVKLSSNVKGLIESASNPIVIEFDAPKNVILSGTLKTKSKSKLENCVIVQRDSKTLKFAVITILPESNTKFFLTISAKLIDDKSSVAVAGFQLICKDTNITNKIPSYFLNFEKELECVSHYNQLLFVDQSLFTLEFSAPKKTLILPHLYKVNSEIKIDNCSIVQRNAVNNNYAVILLFPDQFETYSLKMFARYDSDEGSTFSFVGEFRLICKITKIDQDIPKYSIEFDKGLKLLQPSSLIQKISASPHVLEFSAPKNTLILAHLYKFNTQDKLDDCVIIQRNSVNNNYAVILLFPNQFETYSLMVFAKYDSEEGKYPCVGEFRFLCQITESNNKEMPKYEMEFKRGLKTLQNTSLIQFVDASPHIIELTGPKSLKILADICSIDDTKIPDCCVIQRDSNNDNIAIISTIPEPKSNFKLNLYARDTSDSTSSYPSVGEFRLICDIQKENKAMPKMKIAFDLGLECLSHYSSIIYADKNPIQMEFNSPENCSFLFNLFENENKINGATLLQKNTPVSKLKLSIALPEENDNFVLKVYGKNDPNLKTLDHLGKFNIKKNKNFIFTSVNFPKIFSVDFDYYIYEPICSTLTISKKYNFKVYADGVNKMAVIIGSDWFYLDRDDEEKCWIREIVIRNGEVAKLAACLSNSNPTIAEYKLKN